MSHAVTPICGGNHVWWRAYSVGSERVKDQDVYSHIHNGHICWIETRVNRVLKRCACGAEAVFDDGNYYLVHHIDYAH